ncbi:GNAT family N-acetyltransferase [Bifidobacterium longum]|nr:GNAT family N-acetyltransferase [Bifidobacterium longum]
MPVRVSYRGQQSSAGRDCPIRLSSMDDMTIRRATAADIPQIDELLRQVLEVHHAGRPDLFKGGVKKYTDEELKAILANDQTPVFVAVAPSANDGTDAEHNADPPATDQVLGYAFCVFQQHLNSNILTDIKTLYIDDLCVDERSRGHHVGSTLYRYVLDFARQSGCHNVTLNVWACNPKAQAFYERMGLTPYHIGMEQVL